jgi:hypothetical protein
MGGRTTWYVPDGYLPAQSTGGQPSHEAICVLNTGAEDARLTVTFYFEDRDPQTVDLVVGAERTWHVRLDRLGEHGLTLPTGVPYAYRVVSSVPVVVQHSRLDTTQPAYSLFTTMAYPED